MKVFRKIKVLMGIIWLIFCFIGIISNFTHYDFVDWIIIIVVTIFPFIINHIIKTLHHKTSHNKITHSHENAIVQDNNLHADITTKQIPHLSNIPSNDMLSGTITVDVHDATFLSSQDDAYLNTLLPNGKTIREQNQLAFQLCMGIYPSGTPSFCEMKIVPNTIPPMENYHVLNDDEQKFFRFFHDELVKNKFHPERIRLTRLSNGCFNVDYIGLCYIGKINLYQPPITYSVKKEGNKRATKTFSSLSDAEEFIQGKNNYYIVPCQENYNFSIQYTQGSRNAKNIRVTSVEECIMYIPYWIRYLKYCKRN